MAEYPQEHLGAAAIVLLRLRGLPRRYFTQIDVKQRCEGELLALRRPGAAKLHREFLRRSLGELPIAVAESDLLAQRALSTRTGLIRRERLAWASPTCSGRLMRGTLLADISWSSATVHGRTVVAVAAIAVACGVVIGILPALQARGASLAESLAARYRIRRRS